MHVLVAEGTYGTMIGIPDCYGLVLYVYILYTI